MTGIILTKLDGTAKGGIAVAIQSELDIPVKYIGVERPSTICRNSIRWNLSTLFFTTRMNRKKTE